MANTWQPHASNAGSQWAAQGTQQPRLRSSTFRDMVHSFPAPRHTPSRVVKPRSAGNSPSSASRRRTTLPHGSSGHRPVFNQSYQTPYDPALLAAAMEGRRSRPISWHPASVRQSPYQTPQSYQWSAPSTTAFGTQPLNTVSAPAYDFQGFSHTTPDTPVSVDGLSNISGVQNTLPMQQTMFPQLNTAQLEQDHWKLPSDTSSLPPSMVDDWTFDALSADYSMPADIAAPSYASVPSSGCLTGPSTPDFLPIQNFDDNLASITQSPLDDDEPEDELVGMGIYNTPGVLETSRTSALGKGLKLEETFTPSSDNEEDDDEDDDHDDDQEPSENQPSKDQYPEPPQYRQPSTTSFKQPVKPPTNLLHRSFFFDKDDFEPPTITVSRPLDMVDQPCVNYGYGWI